MIVECLLDTNILVYAVDSKPANSEKKATALELILNHGQLYGTIKVINPFFKEV